MRRIFVLIIYFTLFFYADSGAQPSQKKEVPTILENYNKFLDGTGVSQIMHVSAFTAKPAGTFPEIRALNVRNLKVLTLQSDSNYYSLVDFSKAMYSLNGQDSTNLFFNSLFLKLSDYLNGDQSKIAIVLNYRKSKTLKVIIYYDNGIKVFSTLPGIKGDLGIDGPGNPGVSAYGGVISRVAPDPNLKNRLKAGLKTYVELLPHHKPVMTTFPPNENENMIRLEVKNLKGAATPGYEERLFVNIFILPSKQGNLDITFLFTVTYAPGVFGSANEENFRDAAPYYYERLSKFGQKLKEEIRSIVTP